MSASAGEPPEQAQDPLRTPPESRIFAQAVLSSGLAITLADMRRPDQPLVFVNRAFETLSGYSAAQVIGRNCRFLQGDETDPAELQRLRDALLSEQACAVELVNYTRSGERFVNALHLGPIFDENGTLAYYFGSQWDVTAQRELSASLAREQERADRLSQRLRDAFALVNAIVGLSTPGEARSLGRTIEQRILALSRACALLDDAAKIDLRELVEAALQAHVDPHDARLTIAGEPVRIAQRYLSLLGIALDALASASRRHGALAQPAGSACVTWALQRPQGRQALCLTWTEERAAGETQRSFGDEERDAHALLTTLLAGVGGAFNATADERGSVAEVLLPLPEEAMPPG